MGSVEKEREAAAAAGTGTPDIGGKELAGALVLAGAALGLAAGAVEIWKLVARRGRPRPPPPVPQRMRPAPSGRSGPGLDAGALARERRALADAFQAEMRTRRAYDTSAYEAARQFRHDDAVAEQRRFYERQRG